MSPPVSPYRAWLRAGAVTAALPLAILAALAALAPATPDSDGDDTQFNALRAYDQLQQIASEPRPMGSPAHAGAQAHIIDALEGAGLETERHDTLWVSSAWMSIADGYPVRAVYAHNLLGRLRGSAPDGTPAVLLVAHYDSKTTTPGASDDGFGTAALLEVARALAEGPQPVRDVILLFTDAEEIGLMGAGAFVAEHPWQAEVGVVFNFEARGNAGPVIMFETSGPNLSLARALAHAMPHPVGNSLARAVYERMPNGTDFTLWIDRRTPGMNFANIGGVARYHAPTDTLARADLGTLDQHGRTALALARHYGATPADRPLVPDEGDAVYFDLCGLVFLVYPAAWTPWLTVLAALLLVAFVAVARRRGRLAPAQVGRALGAHAAALVGASIVSVGLLVALRALDADLFSPSARPGVAALGLWAFVALAPLAVGLSSGWLAARASAVERAAAGLFLYLALILLFHRALPEGAYLLQWPAILLGAANLAALFVPRPHLALALPLALAVPGFLLLTGSAYNVALAFGLMAGPALTLVGVLVLAPLASLVDDMTPPRPRALPAALAAVALVLVVAAMATPSFDADHPRPGTLLLAYDADRGEARWLSPVESPAPWARLAERAPQPAFFPLEPARVFLTGPAGDEARDFAAGLEPTVTRVDERHVRVTAPASTIALAIYAPDAGLRGARLDGRALPLWKGGLYVHVWGPPEEGVVLELDGGVAPLQLRVLTQTSAPAGLVPAPPPGSMTKPSMVLPPHQELMDGDTVLCARTFSL